MISPENNLGTCWKSLSSDLETAQRGTYHAPHRDSNRWIYNYQSNSAISPD